MNSKHDHLADAGNFVEHESKFMSSLVDKLHAAFRVFMTRFISVYGHLPDTYLTVDIETTGSVSVEEYIVQIGHCFVRDRQVVDRNSFYFRWPEEYIRDVDQRLDNVNKIMLAKDPNRNVITPAILREQGVDPYPVLRHYKDWFEELHEDSIPLVTHNGCLFDMAFLYQHFVRFLDDQEWSIRNDLVFDTGAMVKAAQLDEPVLHQGEDLFTMAVRVNTLRRKGVRWALNDFVVPGLGFVEKYNLDTTNAHNAGYDAYVVHLLFEYLRSSLVSNPRG